MLLLLCLVASLAFEQAAAGISRGVVHPASPNFHSIHHGYGATSYQNVQVENYRSVPIPTEHHRNHVLEEQHYVIHVQREPHYAGHEYITDHLEVPLEVNLIPINGENHLRNILLLEKVPHVNSEVQNVEVLVPHYNSDKYGHSFEHEYH